jgi:hypothetical protein
VSGDHLVEKVRYEAPAAQDPAHPSTGSGRTGSGRVWINARQYFDSIDPETWAFRIGGYQVLEKSLKDRKGRQLDIDDITDYRKIAVALEKTRRLMSEIDATATPLFASAAGEKGGPE